MPKVETFSHFIFNLVQCTDICLSFMGLGVSYNLLVCTCPIDIIMCLIMQSDIHNGFFIFVCCIAVLVAFMPLHKREGKNPSRLSFRSGNRRSPPEPKLLAVTLSVFCDSTCITLWHIHSHNCVSGFAI